MMSTSLRMTSPRLPQHQHSAPTTHRLRMATTRHTIPSMSPAPPSHFAHLCPFAPSHFAHLKFNRSLLRICSLPHPPPLGFLPSWPHFAPLSSVPGLPVPCQIAPCLGSSHLVLHSSICPSQPFGGASSTRAATSRRDLCRVQASPDSSRISAPTCSAYVTPCRVEIPAGSPHPRGPLFRFPDRSRPLGTRPLPTWIALPSSWTC